MTGGPLSPAHVAQMRAAQTSIMTSRVRINQPGKRVYNRTTRREETVEGEMVYTGRGRVQPTHDRTGTTTTGGGEAILTPRHVCAVPWDVEGIMPGQILTITHATAADTVGQRYAIVSVDRGDGPAASARRFHCELLDERAERPQP